MEAAQGVKRPHPENGDAEGDGAKKRFQSANGVSDNSGASEFGGEIKESENGGGREFVRRGRRRFGERGYRGGRGFGERGGRGFGERGGRGGRGFRERGGRGGRGFGERGGRGRGGFQGRGRGYGGDEGFGRGRGMGGRGGIGRGSTGNFRGAGDFSSRRESNAGSNYSSSSKVYSDFPDWHADKIHVVLEMAKRYPNYPRWEPDRTIWNTLIKEVNPTFKTVLHYFKKMLLSATHKEKVKGLPRLWQMSLADAIKEKANLSQLEREVVLKRFFESMSPSERCPYYLHHFEKTNAVELEWFNYYKEKPEKFQDQCKVYKLNDYRDFEFNS
ncbi:hypothetical protein R5R35_001131 [Gryllus longicercus]|uniref:Uncharacterized protein n=1 Tax=Gryllus longicercus TaxID=2509291 RepID=A0AAN9ZAU0_9ORTH